MVQVLFLIRPHLHEKLPLAISKMASCSKKQKRAVILRRKRLLQRCFFHFEKSSFLVKTVLLKKIQKLDVAYEEYNRSPRRVGRKRSTDWLQSHFVSLVTGQQNDDLLLSLRMWHACALIVHVLCINGTVRVLCKARLIFSRINGPIVSHIHVFLPTKFFSFVFDHSL